MGCIRYSFTPPGSVLPPYTAAVARILQVSGARVFALCTVYQQED